MAAEQKALATYYQLINLTDDPDLKDILRFLGEREVVHYQRFGEALMDVQDKMKCKKWMENKHSSNEGLKVNGE